MGASGWKYRGEFDGDPVKTLHAIQKRIFESGDYLWEEEDDDEPRPATVEELWEIESVQESGTHSLMDVSEFVLPDAEPGIGAIRPLNPAELVALFGTEQPTVADYDRIGDMDLPEQPRWTGKCAVLYENGKPVELALWGNSGD